MEDSPITGKETRDNVHESHQASGSFHTPDSSLSPSRKTESAAPHPVPGQPPLASPTIKEKTLNFFDSHYKSLFIIPAIMFIAALVLVAGQYLTTGSLINKDVTLKGGLTLTVIPEKPVELISFELALKQALPNHDISVRSLSTGEIPSFVVAADIDGTDKETLDNFMAQVEEILGNPLSPENSTVEIIGSSLGQSFFREMVWALLFAFLFMGIVVILYFRLLIPSVAVIIAAFSDIVTTLAIVNLMGMKLGTGGIAAFLMLIGYSVDTDMLLITRVMKRREGSVFQRIVGAFKTGMTMTLTTLGAVIVSLIFVESETIRQILTIILIGLTVDMVTTWIQNVGIIRLYLERKEKRETHG